ncbi:MAG: hypothetical protein ACMUEM_05505 [Flavobacteriales bacterium AspAUS03]
MIFNFGIATFVSISAIFPTMAANYKGTAVSLHNLSADLSNFVGPIIAITLLPYFDTNEFIWVYAIIYVIGTIVAHFTKIDQYSQS